jgi:tetratricopeptide (TPR) repeat protein
MEDKAITFLEDAQKTESLLNISDRCGLFRDLAQVYLRTDPQKSCQILEQIINLTSATSDDHHRALTKLADIYFTGCGVVSQNWDRTLEYLNKYFNSPYYPSRDNYFQARWQRGTILCASGFYLDSITDLTAALEDYTMNSNLRAKILAYRGDAYFHLGQAHWLTAINDYRDALRYKSLSPDTRPIVYYRLGVIYLETDAEPRTIRECLNKALEYPELDEKMRYRATRMLNMMGNKRQRRV